MVDSFGFCYLKIKEKGYNFKHAFKVPEFIIHAKYTKIKHMRKSSFPISDQFEWQQINQSYDLAEF